MRTELTIRPQFHERDDVRNDVQETRKRVYLGRLECTAPRVPVPACVWKGGRSCGGIGGGRGERGAGVSAAPFVTPIAIEPDNFVKIRKDEKRRGRRTG